MAEPPALMVLPLVSARFTSSIPPLFTVVCEAVPPAKTISSLPLVTVSPALMAPDDTA
jgi:hypothetical protein